MFKEAGLAGTDSRFEKRRSQMRLALGAGLATLLVLLAAGLGVSYFRNQNYVAEMTAKSAALDSLAKTAPQQGSVVGVLPLLNAARELPGGYAERDAGVPLLNRFGLSQADKLGTGAQTTYRRLLRSALLPRVAGRIEEVLRRGDANNQEYLYEALRMYLMLGQNSHLDPDSVQAWLAIDWSRNLPDATPEQRDVLAQHVAAMLEPGADSEEPLALDASLIAQTRMTLAMMPLPQRVYNRLKRVVAQAKLPDFSVSSAVGRDVSQVLSRKSGEPLTRGISGVYSVAGYKELLKEAPQAMLDIAQDSWVLDRREAQGAIDAVSGDQMRGAVLELYYADYIKQWDGLLADVRILPFSSLDQGARITNNLSAADSPLRQFLQAAAKETKLAAAAGKAPALDQAVLNKLAAARKKLEAALGAEALPAAGPVASNPVDQHFEPLHKLVGAPGGTTAPPLDAMLAMLKDVSVYFDAAENARKAGLPPPAADALQRIKREADGKPAPLGEMMQNIDSVGAGLTLGSERARLKALWDSTGANFCREASSGRYPLVRGATKDVTLDDFGKLFGPGGVMDDFFSKNMAAQVDMSGPAWKWRDAAIGIPQDTLNQFQRAARLREMFFAAGGRQPGLRFELTPVSADPALSKVTFDVDGQPVVYTAGVAARPVPITLPSGKGGGLVRIEATPAVAVELRGDGPWGWFRMVDKGSLVPTSQGERYKLTFDLGGRAIVYDLTASSVINPFRRDGLEQFRCPTAW
jgi:type VI secretion system protein ImpL